eukprot:c14815_g1_i1 orf=430-717(-)
MPLSTCLIPCPHSYTSSCSEQLPVSLNILTYTALHVYVNMLKYAALHLSASMSRLLYAFLFLASPTFSEHANICCSPWVFPLLVTLTILLYAENS